jgi:hypothetical protein
MKTMKVIVIDSAKRLVYEATTSTYKDIYALLGENVSCFACPVQFNDSDGLFVDDEGLYNTFEAGYMFPDWEYPVCGNGVIVGSDDEGETADVRMSVQEVQDSIIWVDKTRCEAWRNHVLGNGGGFRVYTF